MLRASRPLRQCTIRQENFRCRKRQPMFRSRRVYRQYTLTIADGKRDAFGAPRSERDSDDDLLSGSPSLKYIVVRVSVKVHFRAEKLSRTVISLPIHTEMPADN